MARIPTPAPTVKIELSQSIDGTLYSTRRAALVHDDGKGARLYYDREPTGYFAVKFTQGAGATPSAELTPLRGDALVKWASRHGAAQTLRKIEAAAPRVALGAAMRSRAPGRD
jgi:hypothetical protein